MIMLHVITRIMTQESQKELAQMENVNDDLDKMHADVAKSLPLDDDGVDEVLAGAAERLLEGANLERAAFEALKV